MAQHAFWIIVDGTTPTSFRSRQREDLLPTLTQLKRTQPQVSLMWFERGRLWPSPTEAREALGVQRKTRPGRGRDWRPGGEHVDPRAKYMKTRDEKRARFKSRLGRDRSEAPPSTPTPTGGEPQEPKPSRPAYRRPDSRPDSRPAGRPEGRSDDRPTGRPTGRPDRPEWRKPGGSYPRRDSRGPESRGPGSRPSSPPPRRDGPPRESSEKPKAPKGFGDRPWRPKKPWRPTKPKGGGGSGSR